MHVCFFQLGCLMKAESWRLPYRCHFQSPAIKQPFWLVQLIAVILLTLQGFAPADRFVLLIYLFIYHRHLAGLACNDAWAYVLKMKSKM